MVFHSRLKHHEQIFTLFHVANQCSSYSRLRIVSKVSKNSRSDLQVWRLPERDGPDKVLGLPFTTRVAAKMVSCDVDYQAGLGPTWPL